MKCVNAVWELRNLGVKTIKIEVEKNDAPEKVLDMIEDFRQQYDAKYVVVNCNTRYTGFSIILQKAGFLLIDNQVLLKLTRENALKALEEYKEVLDDVSYKLADENDLQMIFSEFEKGIFKVSDYIVLDPYFSTETKNRRFIYFVQDMIKNNADMFLTFYQNKPIGFFMGKLMKNKKSDGLLGGIFNRPETYHQGSFYLLAGTKCFVEWGGISDNCTVSLNNPDILRLHLAFGRVVIGAKNVFVKHYD